MKIEKIKSLVNEYAKNLSLLFVTNEVKEVSEYVKFFKFLFNKITYASTGKGAKNLYDDSIDLVIVHISGNIKEFTKLIKAIRKKSDDIYILAFTTDAEKRINFNLNSRYHVDGFIPIPFNKDKIYFYLYRLLKRIIERKELEAYIQELEDVHDNFFHEKKEVVKNRISKEKLNDIRFTEEDTITASEFVATLDDTIVDKAEDFLEMLNQYTYTLDQLSQNNPRQSLSSIKSLIAILREFYCIVDTLALFPIIVRTFDTIINFLNSLSHEQLENNERKSTLILIFEGLENDLTDWITNIFIERATDNIHYFDASFANNVVEMEAIFRQTEIESDEDDLEFF